MKKKQEKKVSLCSQERENVISVVDKLGWTARWMKPGLAFNVCQLSSSLNNRKEDNILKTDRIPTKHKRDTCKNGKSQGGFIVFFFWWMQIA